MLFNFLILEFFTGISGPIYISKIMSIQVITGIITASECVLSDIYQDFQDLGVGWG